MFFAKQSIIYIYFMWQIDGIQENFAKQRNSLFRDSQFGGLTVFTECICILSNS